jgi:hypothetical protein
MTANDSDISCIMPLRKDKQLVICNSPIMQEEPIGRPPGRTAPIYCDMFLEFLNFEFCLPECMFLNPGLVYV